MSGRVAVEALVVIRRPSVEPVLRAARIEDNRTRQICVAAVIRGVEGIETGRRLLEQAAAGAPDPTEKQRLERVAHYVSSAATVTGAAD
jgi:hypothetical protein